MLSQFQRLNHRHVLPDAFAIVLSFYVSLYLRVGSEFPQFVGVLNRHILLILVIRLATFTALGVYDIIWRYVSLGDAAKLARAVSFSTLLIIASTYLIDLGRVPRAVFFIDALFVLCLLGGGRLVRRLLHERQLGSLKGEIGEATLIVGAGTTG